MKKLWISAFLAGSILFAQEKLSFFEAVARNESDLVDYMLRSRAEVNVTNADGMTPLHLVSDVNIANALILNGANVNAQNNRGSSPLHWAVSRNKEAVSQLLLEYGANPNASDSNGNTPLHWAAQDGNNPLILILIRKGADVNSTNKAGSTPLLTALANGHTKSSGYLTLAGAREISNQEALAPSSFVSPVVNPDLSVVLELDAIPPLIREIFTENYAEAERLIQKGADLGAADVNGNTALHWAFTKRNHYLSRLLLDRGADINAPNNRGQSPGNLLEVLDDANFSSYIRRIAGNRIDAAPQKKESDNSVSGYSAEEGDSYGYEEYE